MSSANTGSDALNVWIVSDYPDMPESYIYAELPKLGINLTLFHAPSADPANIALIRDAGAECVEITIRNRLDFRASGFLKKELAKRPCDLIYATVNKPLAAVLRATAGYPEVVVVGYRGTIGHIHRYDPASWITFFHPGLDHIVAVSDAVKRYFTETHRMPESKVTRIYKGHDISWYDTGAGKPPKEGPGLRVGFVGQIRHVKGVEYLLDAMKLIPRDRNVMLTLIGGISDDYLKKRIAQDTASDSRITHLGYRKDATRLVGGLDVTVMPTVEREGLAKAVIESLSQGVPAIVSKVGGLPEVVVDGECGFVVPPRDPSAIASAIMKLADDPELLRRFGEAARRRVITQFDYRKSGVQFAELFARLVRERRINRR